MSTCQFVPTEAADKTTTQQIYFTTALTAGNAPRHIRVEQQVLPDKRQ